MIDLKVMMFSKKKNIFCDYAEAILKSYFNENEYLSIRGNYETVETLKLKSMNHLLYCFEKVMSCISNNSPLPVSDETWRRKPFTRKEMLDLFEIKPLIHDKAEIEKRIRAASYPGLSGAFVTIDGHIFYSEYDDRKSIVE